MKNLHKEIETDAFLIGDEVYLIGQKDPFGMVTRINKVTVSVKRHKDKHNIKIKPSKIYLGKDWHFYN